MMKRYSNLAMGTGIAAFTTPEYQKKEREKAKKSF
jgi:hypothetical protein